MDTNLRQIRRAEKYSLTSLKYLTKAKLCYMPHIAWIVLAASPIDVVGLLSDRNTFPEVGRAECSPAALQETDDARR